MSWPFVDEELDQLRHRWRAMRARAPAALRARNGTLLLWRVLARAVLVVIGAAIGITVVDLPRDWELVGGLSVMAVGGMLSALAGAVADRFVERRVLRSSVRQMERSDRPQLDGVGGQETPTATSSARWRRVDLE